MIEKILAITEDSGLEDLPNNHFSTDQTINLIKAAYTGWLDYGAGVLVRDNIVSKSLQFIPLHECGKLCNHPIPTMAQYLAVEHGMSGQWIMLIVASSSLPCLQGFAIKLAQSMDDLKFTIA